MARRYTALIDRTRLPDRLNLHAALKALEFKLIVDDGYDPPGFSGYLPCTLNGEYAGVTIEFENGAANNDNEITVMLAAAMANACGAVVNDARGQAVLAETLVANARKQFDNLD